MTDLRIVPAHLLSVSGQIEGVCGIESYSDRHAVAVSKPLTFRLCVPRQIGAVRATLILESGYGTERLTFPLTWEGLFGVYDVYAVDLTDRVPAGLWFLNFSFATPIGLVYAQKKGVGKIGFSQEEPEETGKFQLTVYEKRKTAPDWIDGGIIYQIFIDRFHRGKDTPIPAGMEFVSDWNSHDVEYPAYPGAPMKNNRVWGGNLSGITEKLDGLASLGVSVLYLSPIFSSPSNHRYDTSDYMSVDPLCGDEKDLKDLFSEARKRGIRVILDGVFNHTGSDSIYFNKARRFPSIGAYQGPTSPYYKWFHFKRFPDSYDCWWDIPILPRMNPDEPSCRAFLSGEKGVVAHYTEMGAAGFRLDVVDELSDEFIASVKDRMTSIDRESIVYGEVWEDASNKIAYEKRKRYYLGKELDGVMNYPFRTAVIEFLRFGNTTPMLDYLENILPNMPKEIMDRQMNLIGTHDTVRALTALAGEDAGERNVKELSSVRMTETEYRTGRARLILAYLLSATFPGVPMIYYGDEAGMEGYSDPMNRMPYPWGKEDPELIEAYKKIGSFRRSNDAFKKGALKVFYFDKNLMIYKRKHSKRPVYLFINRSQSSFEISFKGNFKDLISGRIIQNKLAINPVSFLCLSPYRS